MGCEFETHASGEPKTHRNITAEIATRYKKPVGDSLPDPITAGWMNILFALQYKDI